MSVCRLEHISKQYEDMGEHRKVIQDFSWNVEAGEILLIKGSSGIGKSTLLFLMGGLMHPTSGKVFWNFTGNNEVDLSKLKEKELAGFMRKDVGYLFQDTILFPTLTVREHLLFAEKISKKGNGGDIDKLLEQMGLTERQFHLPSQLSGGQRRRTAAAMNVLKHPKLLLADEPTNDLDDQYEEVMNQLFVQAAKEGSAVVLVSHRPERAPENVRVLDFNRIM